MKLEIATGPPLTIDVVLRFRSAPDVPTEPSTIRPEAEV